MPRFPSRVTILIATFDRNFLLSKVLGGLVNQSFKDFEVLVIAKGAKHELDALIKCFSDRLKIRLFYQKSSGLMNAYMEGLNESNGEVTIFLDDDAVPEPNCILNHLECYQQGNIAGVSGDVIPATLKNGVVQISPLASSEVAWVWHTPKVIQALSDKLWDRPIEGQEKFFAYISKAGYSQKNIKLLNKGKVNSLLCMGANMSVRTSALRGFTMPVYLHRGIAFEQIIGWKLWKDNSNMVFQPRAKVYHIKHGESLSRNLTSKNISQAIMENELLFYCLLPSEKQFSKMHRIVALTYFSMVHLMKIRKDRIYEIAVLKGMFLGNIIGLKWLISGKTGFNYDPTYKSI